MTPVRFSRLKQMGRSPAHYQAAVEEQTASMERGSAVHSLVLGGPPVLFFPGIRRGKAWDDFEATNSGAIIVTEKEHAKAQAMAKAVRENPIAKQVLEGLREVEVNWTFLGRACKSHVDVVGNGYVTELKTAQCSEPSRFMWQAIRYNYHAQLAFYDEAVRSSGLGDPLAQYVVVVESSAPHVVTTLRLTDRALEKGRRVYRLWFERLLACEHSGDWPGYLESCGDFDCPEDDVELTFASDEVETAA